MITPMEIGHVPCVLTAMAEEGQVLEVRFRPDGGQSLLGNIYIAHVENIAENIQSAFLELKDGEKCYFSLKEQEQLLFADPRRKAPLRAGDDIIVQICRDAMKGKMPSATANLNFTGKYLVLTTGKKGIGISAKIDGDDRKRLRRWLEEAESEDFGLIVRTNAKEAEREELFLELDYLKKRWERVQLLGKSRVTRSLLEEAEPFYLAAVRDAYQDQLEEILVEGREIYEKVKAYLEDFLPEYLPRLVSYEDRLLPLHKLYSIETVLKRIRQEKIWLNSGGFLVIQQTEAFVSIDVNSGKFAGKKKMEETFRKINLEAAGVIAKQIRLRNLSGILLVDFINMNQQEHKEELLHVLAKHVRKDPVKTVVIDMTKLDIVELTRKKVRRPLEEDFRELESIKEKMEE